MPDNVLQVSPIDLVVLLEINVHIILDMITWVSRQHYERNVGHPCPVMQRCKAWKQVSCLPVVPGQMAHSMRILFKCSVQVSICQKFLHHVYDILHQASIGQNSHASTCALPSNALPN